MTAFHAQTLHQRSEFLPLGLTQSFQILIDSSLNLRPEAQDLGVAERQDLACNHPAHALLPIRPPEQVGQPGPPARALAVDRRWLEVQEECQPPALRDVVRLWIQFWQRVGVLWLRGRDGCSAEVGDCKALVWARFQRGGDRGRGGERLQSGI